MSGGGGAVLDLCAVGGLDDTIALVYHAIARRSPDDEPYDVNVGSVYVRRDGRWQLFLHQHSPTG